MRMNERVSAVWSQQAFISLGINPTEMDMSLNPRTHALIPKDKDLNKNVYSIIIVIVKSWKQTKQPPTVEWTKKYSMFICRTSTQQ